MAKETSKSNMDDGSELPEIPTALFQSACEILLTAPSLTTSHYFQVSHN